MSDHISWVMAFDFGLARIGVAVGNTLLRIPHPISAMAAKTNEARIIQIDALVKKWKPEYFVVGMPSKIDDKIVLVDAINNFVNLLFDTFHLATVLINEDYSSCVASLQLSEQNITGRNQKYKLDPLAASLILQTYFDEYRINVS